MAKNANKGIKVFQVEKPEKILGSPNIIQDLRLNELSI